MDIARQYKKLLSLAPCITHTHTQLPDYHFSKVLPHSGSSLDYLQISIITVINLQWSTQMRWFAANFEGKFQSHLHATWDGHSFAENLMQMPCAHRVTKGGLGQQSCRMMGIFYIRNWYCSIIDAIVHDSIHANGDAVFCQNLDANRPLKLIRVETLIEQFSLKFHKGWRMYLSFCSSNEELMRRIKRF